jgi:hypothetical protein
MKTSPAAHQPRRSEFKAQRLTLALPPIVPKGQNMNSRGRQPTVLAKSSFDPVGVAHSSSLPPWVHTHGYSNWATPWPENQEQCQIAVPTPNPKALLWGLVLGRNQAVENGREKRGGAKAAENRGGKPVTATPLCSERTRIRNALRLFAFSASLRLFRPRSTAWFRSKASLDVGCWMLDVSPASP